MNIYSPLSGSNDTELIKIIEAKQLIADWQVSFAIDITDELHGVEKIYLYQCKQTQLKFFVPSDIAGSSKLYEQLQNFDWYYMHNKWEHHVALKDLSECKHILEVGSGFGDFVKLGIDAGLDIRGIELNEAAVIAAQEKNLPVERLDLKEAVDLYLESLDAVCSFQVLEHIPNPKDFINWSIQMLKPGGKLIFCVPNADSFLKPGYFLLDLPPHHMLQWSEYSFKALEKFFPIKLEKIDKEPLASYHVSSYLSSYFSYYSLKFPYIKIFFNRYSMKIFELLFKMGIRNYLTGMSLYIQFRKV